MAGDDLWSRKRREEEEEEREREEAKERAEREAKAKVKLGLTTSFSRSETVSDSFDNLVREAPILIEQLNHLYTQFAAGVLSMPPREVRSRLDHMLILLTSAHKPTPASRFRFQGIQASYASHCARWDKLLHDVESGKIRRIAGPKNARNHR